MFVQEKDLFHLYIHGKRNKLKKASDYFLFFMSFFQGIIWDLTRVIRIKRNKNYEKPVLRNKILIHADTINNFNTLNFLRTWYPDAVLTCIGGFVGGRKDAQNLRYGYSSQPNFIKYLFLLYLYFHPRYGSRMIQLIKLDYFYPEFFRFLFQNNQPKIVIISNDHTPSARGMILVAKKMGIKTVYFQHACVTGIFPPLKFDFSFLYGAYSQSIYEAIGKTEGLIFTVGNSAFDEFREAITEKKRSFKIGIAYNALDGLDDVEYLVRELYEKVGEYEICLRPHPADGRKIPFRGRFSVSNSKTQSSLEFLKEMDIVIAGNTSLLLEAACMNVLPLQYDFTEYDQYLRDYYGFIRNGLALNCVSIEEIIDRINNFGRWENKDIRSRAMAYDSSIASDYEFQVKGKIFSILNNYSLWS